MHGHCASLPPGRPVLRRRNLLSLARWWPTAAGLTGPYTRIYPETRPCALLVGCCLAHWGTWVWGGGRSVAGGLRLHVHRALPAGGSRGVLSPVGWSGHPARPMGGHLLQRTGRTGPGGTGSPAQGVFGVSCQANGGPFSSENRAHRPGGDGESCPGGVRSLLPGQGGGIIVWCGVVWCGVVWCGVPKALLPNGKGRDVYPRVQVNGLGCVCCVRAVCKCGVA